MIKLSWPFILITPIYFVVIGLRKMYTDDLKIMDSRLTLRIIKEKQIEYRFSRFIFSRAKNIQRT